MVRSLPGGSGGSEYRDRLVGGRAALSLDRRFPGPQISRVENVVHGRAPRTGPIAISRSPMRRRKDVQVVAVQLAPTPGLRPFRAGARPSEQNLERRLSAL